MFYRDVVLFIRMIEEMGNFFMEEIDNFLVLDIKEIMSYLDVLIRLWKVEEVGMV